MQKKQKPEVHRPKNINDALNILKRKPECVIFAGGSDIYKNFSTPAAPAHAAPAAPAVPAATPVSAAIPHPPPNDILLLDTIDELKRVYRSDSFLELGSMVNFERLSCLKTGIIPQGLIDWIHLMVPPHIRSIATIGGNLLADARYISAFHYLSMNDARVELRKSSGSRWVPMNKLREGQKCFLLNSEIITRVRLPLIWNHQHFRCFHSHTSGREYAFCALASVRENILERIRIAYTFTGLKQFCDYQLESCIVGRRLPLPKRDADQFLKNLEIRWRKDPCRKESDDLARERLHNLSAWFLHTIANA
ncbi:MAG: FAD binding domain-containing protein [Salinispira sp.]